MYKLDFNLNLLVVNQHDNPQAIFDTAFRK